MYSAPICEYGRVSQHTGFSVATKLDNRADFDGDALHIWLILDKDMDKRFIRLAPSRSVLSMDNPRSVSNVFTQQAPQTLTMASWLKGGRTNPNRKRKQVA